MYFKKYRLSIILSKSEQDNSISPLDSDLQELSSLRGKVLNLPKLFLSFFKFEFRQKSIHVVKVLVMLRRNVSEAEETNRHTSLPTSFSVLMLLFYANLQDGPGDVFSCVYLL